MADDIQIGMEVKGGATIVKEITKQRQELAELKKSAEAAGKAAKKEADEARKTVEKQSKAIERLNKVLDDTVKELQAARQAQAELGDEAAANAKAAGLVEKYRKKVDDLEGQLAEARAEQAKATNEAKEWEKAARVADKYKARLDKAKQSIADLKAKQKEAQAEGRKWDAVAGSIKNIAAGILGVGGIVQAVNFWRDANREILEQTEKIGLKLDENTRRLRVQNGLTAEQGEATKGRILAAAQKFGVSDSQQAFDAHLALTSAGFSNEEASGSALESMLAVLAAGNARGQNVDAGQLASSATAYLQSQGRDLTGANLLDIGHRMTGLASSALKIEDLPSLAKEGSVLKMGLSADEQFASAAALRDVGKAPEEVATGLRAFVLRSKTAGKTPAAARALKSMGLTSDDIDLTGEDQATVLDRLAGGLGRVPEKDRAGVLRSIYEEQGVAVVQSLIDQRGKLAEYRKAQGGAAAQFDEAVDVATSGPNAAANRLRIEEEGRRAAGYTGSGNIRAALVGQSEASGDAPITSKRIVGNIFDFAKEVGLSDQAAAAVAASARSGGAIGIAKNAIFGDDFSEGVKTRLGDAYRGAGGTAAPAAATDPQMEKQNGLLEQIVNNTKPRPPAARPASKPFVPPSKGLSQ